ncbi:hypothetical protein N752_11640 [Desulforamulus aquiferis]|nr:hypothetical protein N752_11640 [Desulforamulus aquiferis]
MDGAGVQPYPTGTIWGGKTHMATGLGIEAIQRGFKMSFVMMDSLINMLKTQEISRTFRPR